MSIKLTRRTFLAGAVCIPTAAFLGCKGGTNNPETKNAVRSWTDLTHEVIKLRRGPYPPAVARVHAMVSTSMFDAWAAYDQVAVGTRLGGALRRPVLERTAQNKVRAISYAAYRTLVDLFPANKAMFDAEMVRLGFDPDNTSTDTATPTGIGNLVANELLTFRHGDGSNQLGDLNPGAYSDYTGYVARNDPDNINDPDHWQPLRISNGAGGFVVQTYAGPHWGMVTPFALSSGSQFRPTRVLSTFGSAEYLAKCQEVISTSANLTDAQKVQTEYWADGPGSVQPPGHWMVFADWVSDRDNNDLDVDVKLFFLVANAVFDAGIACWDAKRVYDSVRPQTAIRYAFRGQTIRAWGGPFVGPVDILGENFGTYQSETFVTPPFPSYLSGHSTYSAAAAEALKRFLGSDSFGFTLNVARGGSQLEPGAVPATPFSITWATFTEAAASAANSRLWGGIHFTEDNVDGIALGRQVGAVVYNKAVAYFAGTA
jgi:hypothetical protein